jgi:hypothetical protein
MKEVGVLPVKEVDERCHRGLVGHARRSEGVTRYEGDGKKMRG